MPKIVTLNEFLTRSKLSHGDRYDYSHVSFATLSDKIKIGCKNHGFFLQRAADHLKGSGCNKCGRLAAKQTCISKYGVDNPFKDSNRIRAAIKAKYGVENISQLDSIKEKKSTTCMANYGVSHPLKSSDIRLKVRTTSLEKYGTNYPIQNTEVKNQMMETKLLRGSFTKSNASIEASEFIEWYIQEKGYTFDQVAFASEKYGLHEWGYYFKGSWMLFDLVVFKPEQRGKLDAIIEILEWNGPFHYTATDVATRGNDLAYPWKNKQMTIEESFNRDRLKMEFALLHSPQYTIFWPDKYHDPSEVIAENVKKLESRYPGGTFDVSMSENRQVGDL